MSMACHHPDQNSLSRDHNPLVCEFIGLVEEANVDVEFLEEFSKEDELQFLINELLQPEGDPQSLADQNLLKILLLQADHNQVYNLDELLPHPVLEEVTPSPEAAPNRLSRRRATPLPPEDSMRHSIADSLMQILANMTDSACQRQCYDLLQARGPLQARDRILTWLQEAASNRTTR